MPATKAKTFSIPVSSSPVKGDVILIANSDNYVYLAQIINGQWEFTSLQVLSFARVPAYADGVVTFTVSYIESAPTKACFVPGPNH